MAMTLTLVLGCSPAATSPTLVGPQPTPSASVPLAQHAPPVRYAMPTCPLRYEVRDVDISRMDGVPLPAEVDTFMTVVARPASGVLELTSTVSAHPKTGKWRAYDVPVDGYAPARLETDGARWTERDGPTQIYGSLGTIEGLAWFFPDLPPTGEPGSRAEWVVARPDQAAMIEVEAGRGSLPGMKEAAARLKGNATPKSLEPVRLDVRLVRWADVGGTKVAELEATGSRKDHESADGAGHMNADVASTYHGRYVVTAAGRMLRANVVKESDVTLVTDFSGQVSTQHHTQRSVHDLALVGACDGPTDPSLAIPLGREEKAIRAWGDAFMAISKGDRATALVVFDPALRKKVGEAKLWDTLTEYRKLRGDQALPPPLLVQERDVTPDGAGLRLAVHGLTLEAAAHVNHQVEVVLSMHEASGVWVVDSLVADVTLHQVKKRLLAITVDGVVLAKGWPPI